MKNLYLFTICLLLVWQSSLAQNAGEAIFDNSFVHEIRINFESDDFWGQLTSNYFDSTNDEGVPTDVPFLIGSILIDGLALDSIGLRQKGFSSHFFSPNQFKKSLKLDFNVFVAGQKYDGLKKLNLNNGVGDPAMQRDFLAYNIMRQAGIKVPRTSYAKVFLNDQYWGLYLLVEQVDKTFVEDHFADGTGDLYKNIGWSTLNWQGSNPDNYQSSIVLRTNEESSDFSDFIEFLDILNNATDEEFAASFTDVFNVDYFLRVLAIDIMTNNWDSYIEHGRNFYLYHEPASGLFHWIPWDYNLSMGGDFGFGDPGGSGGTSLPDDLADCPSIVNGSSPYPATDSIFIATINQDAFCCLIEWDVFCQETYNNISENGTGLPDNLADCQSILNGSCPYTTDDLLFIQVVNNDPTCCTETWSDDCQFAYDVLIGGTPAQYQDFPLIIENEELVLINRIMDIPAFQERYLTYCCEILEHNFTTERLEPIIDHNGVLIREAVELDANYAFSFDDFLYDINSGDNTHTIPSLKEFFNHRIPTLEENLMALGNVCQNIIAPIDWQEVTVNEFMASNDSLSLIVDQNGEADDWIELYNNTNEAIDLSNFYLSDDTTDPTKWRFPAGATIDVDGYLIVWADKDEEQDGLHASFKLAASGEQIILSHLDGTVIDSFSFAEQITNISSARIPNGTGDFFTDVPVTFNGNNEEDPNAVIDLNNLGFKVYPNPANDYFTIVIPDEVQGQDFDIKISNLLGQVIDTQNNIRLSNISIPINGWMSGMYLIEIKGNGFKGMRKLIKE